MTTETAMELEILSYTRGFLNQEPFVSYLPWRIWLLGSLDQQASRVLRLLVEAGS